jgi:hypothetical protein
MKRILLDCSVLRGAPSAAFSTVSLQFEFVITDKTFAELYTHDLDNGRNVAAAEEEAARFLSQVATSARVVMHDVDPIKFEIERGVSGRAAPITIMSSDPPNAIPRLQPDELQQMLMVSEDVGKLWDFKLPPGFEEAGRQLRKRREDRDLWPFISSRLWNSNMVRNTQEAAFYHFVERARESDWTVSNNFCPQPDWITFGWIHVHRAYIYWKYAKHGDEQPSGSPNVSFDMSYAAHMAVCDGLLASDKTLLNMGWACWPKKRDSLYTYDPGRGEIVPYKPDWLE